ncbi:ATP-dependent RNA helicase ddx54 [Nowakowskiella sp. JEL0078]|nr:ATP-dependent RNA helicase ddx54 [Nowakowskiella sp. JEL0078]
MSRSRGGDDDEKDSKFLGDDDDKSEIEMVAAEEAEADDMNVYHSEDENIDDNQNLDSEEKSYSKQIQSLNRKGKASGGFQSMGLSPNVFKAILHKGYKIPTPIQRKTIPVILEGKDVVAMARTGSGKTAAFLLPMIEKLKAHSAKVGARGLVLAPSRELALQTLKFFKDLAKYTDLRACMLVGGDSMDDQFTSMAGNPDVIVATPGRLMHLLVEMNLDLKTVEYVVFDEADRLFEMGFAEQLREIIHKLSERRQTLLYSATLPKLLVDFAKAGLSDPVLVRLDVDTKISKELQMLFLGTKHEDKDASLIYILRELIKPNEQSIIFVATKHHVEYVNNLLIDAGVNSTYIYGALDQAARRIHLARFRNGKAKVLVVTDVAARGIDVPLLDNVINYHFPPAPKIFVHRVGRTARAGKSGTAYSLVSTEELPYVLDLQLFTGRRWILGSQYRSNQRNEVLDSTSSSPDYSSDIIYGKIPDPLLEMDMEYVLNARKTSIILETTLQSAQNGFKLYQKTKGSASNESYSRAKEVTSQDPGIHPLFHSKLNKAEKERSLMLGELSKFRPPETIFETGQRGTKNVENLLMQKRRLALTKAVLRSVGQNLDSTTKSDSLESEQLVPRMQLEDANDMEIEELFPKSYKVEPGPKNFRDEEFYMSHYQKDANTEKGYSVKGGSFAQRADNVAVEIVGDDEITMKSALTWDAKKKKFIRPVVGADNKKRIRTESGASIPASFKSNRFEDWKSKTKINMPRVGEIEDEESSTRGKRIIGERKYRHNKIMPADPNSLSSKRKNAREARILRKSGTDVQPVKAEPKKTPPPRSIPIRKKGTKGPKSELKSASQIAKERKVKSQRRDKTGRHKK